MAELTTIRERTRNLNSLTCLLKGLGGHVTTVDLRNCSSVIGRVTEVDSVMNMTMIDAVFRSADGRTTMTFDEFYIQVLVYMVFLLI